MEVSPRRQGFSGAEHRLYISIVSVRLTELSVNLMLFVRLPLLGQGDLSSWLVVQVELIQLSLGPG